MNGFPERDWKVFTKLQPLATNRYCERALQEVQRHLADASKQPVERFEVVAKLMRERHKDLSGGLADYRRSTAFMQVERFYTLGLLTDEELAMFSPETSDSVLQMRELRRQAGGSNTR
jgi:hypothetical protein